MGDRGQEDPEGGGAWAAAQENFTKSYREYLALLGRIKDADLLRWLEELEEMDRRLKSTAAAPKEMIQAFVVGYGRKAPGRRITSPGRR